MDGGNARMIERREQLRLPLKARHPFLVLEELFRQDLQRNDPLESRVLRPVNLAHPARAERRKDFVRSEARARGEGHKSCAQYRSGWRRLSDIIRSWTPRGSSRSSALTSRRPARAGCSREALPPPRGDRRGRRSTWISSWTTRRGAHFLPGSSPRASRHTTTRKGSRIFSIPIPPWDASTCSGSRERRVVNSSKRRLHAPAPTQNQFWYRSPSTSSR